MFFDLNVPVIAHQTHVVAHQSKKSKGKQPQATGSAHVFTPAQVATIEGRIDLLIHLGYTVIAVNQTIDKKIDPKTHVNILDLLLSQLKPRTGVVFLKRLTIRIDEDSEKGFGLTSASASIADAYDLIALAPTTAATLSAACLTHSLPSPLTTHIIALPLTQPRLPFHLKHTLVRTAIKNGAVFEINYAGALGDPESSHVGLGMTDTGLTAKRHWWAAAREVVRVTKGKGILVSGGVVGEGDYRGPKDVQNLITLLGLPQNLAHDASTVTPKSVVLHAQTRKTYRAVLSEPRVVVPTAEATEPIAASGVPTQNSQSPPTLDPALSPAEPSAAPSQASRECPSTGKKRRREPEPELDTAGPTTAPKTTGVAEPNGGGGPARKKKKKKNGLGEK